MGPSWKRSGSCSAGDPWTYNIKDNRAVLETMTRYAEMVGVTERKLKINELFAESVLREEN
jgi:hypothetical protein